MLYDPKWEVKADPFSLESLIAWLEKQPAHMQYNPNFPEFCLLGQFAKAMGAPCAHTTSMTLSGKADFERIAYFFVNGDADGFTFGAALERARAALAQRQ